MSVQRCLRKAADAPYAFKLAWSLCAVRGGPKMRRSAQVDARSGRLIVSSWDTTQGAYPATVQGDWAEAAEEPVADEAIGALVRSALAASHDGVPYPDFRNDPEPARRRRVLYKLAGVRSETAYAAGTRAVSVRTDDVSGDVRITPYRNGGRRTGFTEMLDEVITIAAVPGDAVLGSALRRALDVATDGT
jgi:hypothetical protein